MHASLRIHEGTPIQSQYNVTQRENSLGSSRRLLHATHDSFWDETSTGFGSELATYGRGEGYMAAAIEKEKSQSKQRQRKEQMNRFTQATQRRVALWKRSQETEARTLQHQLKVTEQRKEARLERCKEAYASQVKPCRSSDSLNITNSKAPSNKLHQHQCRSPAAAVKSCHRKITLTNEVQDASRDVDFVDLDMYECLVTPTFVSCEGILLADALEADESSQFTEISGDTDDVLLVSSRMA
ncbi:hypothetical protein DIPPA_14840 [Diplonema papillatum]|nr:hypothetical protein DIPPA_14840 [Diplonema papillatum]|eukprot:gene2445-3797_t